MAQVVSELPLTLENSTTLTRPDARLFTTMNSNTGETSITQYTLERSRTQMNFPSTGGPRDYRVSCCENNSNNNPARYFAAKSASHAKNRRIELNLIDPITGFLSPAGESLVRIQTRMPSFGKSRVEPQCVVPQLADTIRTQPEAIDELKY